MNEHLKKILNEDQDPRAIEKITAKLHNLLMKNEEIVYMGVQKKPAITVFPDSIVMTNKRIIMCIPKNLGLSMDFIEYDWDDISGTFVKENILGSQFSFSTKTEQVIDIDYIPKNQARKLHTYAKEQMELIKKSFVEKVQPQESDNTGTFSDIEEPADIDTIEAEEVIAYAELMPVQTEDLNLYEEAAPANNLNAKPSQDELFAKLQNYKKLLDNGLILQGEYDAFKKEILGQM